MHSTHATGQPAQATITTAATAPAPAPTLEQAWQAIADCFDRTRQDAAKQALLTFLDPAQDDSTRTRAFLHLRAFHKERFGVRPGPGGLGLTCCLFGRRTRSPLVSHTLKAQDLQNANLEGLDLHGINFENANLKGANFSNSDLRNSNFENANLKGANFSNSDLRNSNFRGANLQQAVMENAQMNGAHFESANMKKTRLYNAHLNNAFLNDTNLQGADLRAAEMENATLCGAEMENAKLRAANMRNVDLRRAIMREGDFKWTKMQNTNLTHADLTGANLADADLTGANLADADLTGANLTNANVTDSNWYLANMTDTETLGMILSTPLLTVLYSSLAVAPPPSDQSEPPLCPITKEPFTQEDKVYLVHDLTTPAQVTLYDSTALQAWIDTDRAQQIQQAHITANSIRPTPSPVTKVPLSRDRFVHPHDVQHYQWTDDGHLQLAAGLTRQGGRVVKQ